VQERQKAWDAFSALHKPKDPPKISTWVVIVLLLIAAGIHPVLFWCGVLLVVLYKVVNKYKKKEVDVKWEKERNAWETEHPDVIKPPLKHFHDPDVELSPKDILYLQILTHWPTQPPFWDSLKAQVLRRDRRMCQITGCPSRLKLYVHHIKSASEGGLYIPDNMLTLCEFHHALEVDKGYEKTVDSFKTEYFTMVREHMRENHRVRGHLRRLKLVTGDELAILSDKYGFICKYCSTGTLVFYIDKKDDAVKIVCEKCRNVISLPRELAEETGPRRACQ
jgi:hypothetical protein